MRFKVPQDVQREDTIIGPITLKQLIILGMGGGVAYGIYVTLAPKYFFEVWLVPVIIITAITIAFAFVKVHELTFTKYLLYIIEYSLMTRQRSWKQGAGEVLISDITVIKKSKEQEEAENKHKRDKEKDLKQLSQLLDNNNNLK